MEDLITIVSIIQLVWGVLCIILFFKVWGATNDIKTIKEKITYDVNNLKEEIRTLHYLGKDDEALQVINTAYLERLQEIEMDVNEQYYAGTKEPAFNARVENAKIEFSRFYKAIDCEIPKKIEEIDFESWTNFALI